MDYLELHHVALKSYFEEHPNAWSMEVLATRYMGGLWSYDQYELVEGEGRSAMMVSDKVFIHLDRVTSDGALNTFTLTEPALLPRILKSLDKIPALNPNLRICIGNMTLSVVSQPPLESSPKPMAWMRECIEKMIQDCLVSCEFHLPPGISASDVRGDPQIQLMEMVYGALKIRIIKGDLLICPPEIDYWARLVAACKKRAESGDLKFIRTMSSEVYDAVNAAE